MVIKSKSVEAGTIDPLTLKVSVTSLQTLSATAIH